MPSFTVKSRWSDQTQQGGGDDEFLAGKSSKRSLSYGQLREPVEGPNGQLTDDEIQWKLSHPSKEGGYIVQHIQVDAQVTDLAGNAIPHPGGINGLDYWEAWRVEPGSDVTVYGAKGEYDDVFRVSSAGPGTHGVVEITAQARFYEGLTLPSDFVPMNPATAAGALPSTAVDPQLWLRPSSAPVNRSYTVSW
jgi:hypothetical protein